MLVVTELQGREAHLFLKFSFDFFGFIKKVLILLSQTRK